MAVTRKAEEEAAAVAVKALIKAYAKMNALVNRRLTASETIDKRWLRATMNQLDDLAEDFARDLMKGEFGNILKKQMVESQKALQAAAKKVKGVKIPDKGISFELDRTTINRVLNNSKVNIKGATDEGIRIVNEIMTEALVTGKSPEQIADDVRYRLTPGTVGGKALTDTGRVTFRRARWIAQNEMRGVHRQAQMRTAKELNLKHFEMTGVIDGRTEPICLRHIGRTMTEKQWRQVHSQTFVYGLHHGCRHDWFPVAGPQERNSNRERRAEEQRKKNAQEEIARKREAARKKKARAKGKQS